MNAAEFAGRRVALRPLTEADAPAVLEAVLASEAQLKRRFRWAQSVLGLADVQRFARAKAQAWQAGAASVFAVLEARGERLVGVLSLDPIRRDTLKAELCLWVRADEQDKGYAVDAGRLGLEYAFRRLALHRIYARIDPANRVARRVLQRLGFRYEGCLRGDKRLARRWMDQECWGVLRADWKPAGRPSRSSIEGRHPKGLSGPFGPGCSGAGAPLGRPSRSPDRRPAQRGSAPLGRG